MSKRKTAAAKNNNENKYMVKKRVEIVTLILNNTGYDIIRPGTIHLTHDSIRFDYYIRNSIRFHMIRFDYIFLKF